MASWITPTFDATRFTASVFPPAIPAPAWVLGSTDATTFAMRVEGKTMTMAVVLETTTVNDGPTFLSIALPYGRVAKRVLSAMGRCSDNGTLKKLTATVGSGGGTISLALTSGGNFTCSTNGTTVAVEIVLEVMTSGDLTGSA